MATYKDMEVPCHTATSRDKPIPLLLLNPDQASRSDLQKKIVKRMREFGMSPVFSGFSGFVPEALVLLSVSN